MRWEYQVRRILSVAALALASLGFASPSASQETTAPTPKLVIYPGDVISDDMLADAPLATINFGGPVAISRAQLVGMSARRTLLPGRAIPLIAVGAPRVVRSGASVKLIYVDGALEIMTFGSAMQDGAVGDLIKVRNDDSGVTVNGEVRPDGAILVNGG